MSIRILITDDHGLLRAALRALLKDDPDMLVVGEARDGHEALEMTRALQPDILLLDISMPGLGGIDVTRQVRHTAPQVRILFLTVHEDERLVREALRAGARGDIIKRALDSELTDAIRAVSRGEVYIHPTLAGALVAPPASDPADEDVALEWLTRREVEILQLIARGYSNSKIAATLHLSLRTIESHRSNIMGKLRLANRVELVHYAREHGLLSQE